MADLMITRRGQTGGVSTGFGFEVVAYASEDLLPVTADENTIAVITGIDITEIIFCSGEPTDPVEGMVWIVTDTSSDVSFTISDGKVITVCPVLCKQYISGAWVEMFAKSYQGGEWVDWLLNLYMDGEFNSAYTHTEKKTPSTATVTYNPKNIVLSTVGGSISEVYTVIGQVDLTTLSKLILEGTFVKNTTTSFTNVAVLFVAPTKNVSYKNATKIKSLVAQEALTAGYRYKLELDVSNLSGVYYIYGGTNTQGSAWSNVRQNTIDRIRGEYL